MLSGLAQPRCRAVYGATSCTVPEQTLLLDFQSKDDNLYTNFANVSLRPVPAISCTEYTTTMAKLGSHQATPTTMFETPP
jgi:hypothetical protein